MSSASSVCTCVTQSAVSSVLFHTGETLHADVQLPLLLQLHSEWVQWETCLWVNILFLCRLVSYRYEDTSRNGIDNMTAAFQLQSTVQQTEVCVIDHQQDEQFSVCTVCQQIRKSLVRLEKNQCFNQVRVYNTCARAVRGKILSHCY